MSPIASPRKSRNKNISSPTSKAAPMRPPPRLRLAPEEVDRRLELVAELEEFTANYVKNARKRTADGKKGTKDRESPSSTRSTPATVKVQAAWNKKVLRSAPSHPEFKDQPLESIRQLRIAKGRMGVQRLRRALSLLGQARTIALSRLYGRARPGPAGLGPDKNADGGPRAKVEVDRLIDELLNEGFPAGRDRRPGADLSVHEFYDEIARRTKGNWYSCLHHLVVPLRKLRGRWPDLAQAFEGVQKGDVPDAGTVSPKQRKRWRGEIEVLQKEFLEIRGFLEKVIAGVKDTVERLEKVLKSSRDE